jgi:drug/metabolite transporter (DMT)-like permease
MPAIDLAAIALLSGIAVLANVMLKLGSLYCVRDGSGLRYGLATLSGFGIYFVALVLYVFLLHRLPVSRLQAVYSLQFLGILLAARFVFGEPITRQQWCGAAMVALGIVLVALARD